MTAITFSQRPKGNYTVYTLKILSVNLTHESKNESRSIFTLSVAVTLRIFPCMITNNTIHNTTNYSVSSSTHRNHNRFAVPLYIDNVNHLNPKYFADWGPPGLYTYISPHYITGKRITDLQYKLTTCRDTLWAYRSANFSEEIFFRIWTGS